MKKKSPATLLVGIPEHHADLEYAAGFRAPDPVVLLCKRGRRYLVVSELEHGRATRVVASRTDGDMIEVLTPGKLGLKGSRRGRLANWASELLRREGLTRVRVPAVFPHGVAKTLERRGFQLRVARDALFPERQVKTREEQAHIRESQQAAVIAMRAAVAQIASATIENSGRLTIKGKTLTAESVRETVTKTLLAHDCFCGEIIVAGGVQATDPHEIGSGPLRAHEAIVLDIFPRHMRHGYWGDLSRTVVRGKASAKLKRMYQAVKAAYAAALARVKPGVRCATVHNAAEEVFRKRRYTTKVRNGRETGFIHSTGHGLGLAIHEGPSVGPGDGRLRSGNVVTIEPGLYYPDIGGIRVEDTIIVTPDGWRYLVPCEKRFEV